MRIMRRSPKKRDPGMELYMARQQAPILGISYDDVERKMLPLIEAKGGDFYRASLNPNPQASAAYDMLGYNSTHTPLQQEIVAEMRNYYGLNTSVAASL